MDINRYIGLCLVKNGYCSISGLGVLRIIKNNAKQSFDGGVITPSSISVQYEDINSIDDQLAHFIGFNENISTNNASNTLSRFGKEIKAQVLAGNPYIIDGLGRFTSQNGKVGFQMVTDFDMGEFNVMPPINESINNVGEANKLNTQHSEPSGLSFKNPESQTPDQFSSLKKVMVPALLILGLAILSYFGYQFLQKKNNETEIKPDIETTSNTNNTSPVASDTINQINNSSTLIDTNHNNAHSNDTINGTAASATVVANGPVIKVAILSFANEEAANMKCKKLASYGNPVTVQKADSNKYVIVVSTPINGASTDKVIDSLRRMFNPKGPVFQVK
jgi:hypothetical protein